jgi:hypothetical protein
MLAGVSLRVEAEEDSAVRPHRPAQPSSVGDANGKERPTAEQLAGVYLEVEAAEDLSVHPHPAVTDPARG